MSSQPIKPEHQDTGSTVDDELRQKAIDFAWPELKGRYTYDTLPENSRKHVDAFIEVLSAWADKRAEVRCREEEAAARQDIQSWAENDARVWTFANIDPIPNGSYIRVDDLFAALTNKEQKHE